MTCALYNSFQRKILDILNFRKCYENMRKISSEKNMQSHTTLFFLNFYLEKKNYFYIFINEIFFKDI